MGKPWRLDSEIAYIEKKDYAAVSNTIADCMGKVRLQIACYLKKEDNVAACNSWSLTAWARSDSERLAIWKRNTMQQFVVACWLFG